VIDCDSEIIQSQTDDYNAEINNKIFLYSLIISVIDCDSEINKSQTDDYNAEINSKMFCIL